MTKAEAKVYASPKWKFQKQLVSNGKPVNIYVHENGHTLSCWSYYGDSLLKFVGSDRSENIESHYEILEAYGLL